MVNGTGQQADNEETRLEEWNPQKQLEGISREEAAWSNGFLRSHPEKWCLGLGEQWLSLYALFGVDIRIGDVKPLIGKPGEDSICFKSTIGEEDVCLSFTAPTIECLVKELHPRASSKAAGAIFVDYVAQRFLVGVAQSQTVLDGASCRFFGRYLPSDCPLRAGVRVTFTLNTVSCAVTLYLSDKIIEKIDGLWRRQIHSASKAGLTHNSKDLVHIELAQLGVQPHVLPDYLKKGAIIDLEKQVSDIVTLRLGHKPLVSAKLLWSQGGFACKIVPGVPRVQPLPDGTTRLSIECGSMGVDAPMLSELQQAGAVLSMEQPLSNHVNLCINQEKVGEARLCVFEGRFAVEVL